MVLLSSLLLGVVVLISFPSLERCCLSLDGLVSLLALWVERAVLSGGAVCFFFFFGLGGAYCSSIHLSPDGGGGVKVLNVNRLLR